MQVIVRTDKFLHRTGIEVTEDFMGSDSLLNEVGANFSPLWHFNISPIRCPRSHPLNIHPRHTLVSVRVGVCTSRVQYK